MTDVLTVGRRRIGNGHPCFIIAEAGVNHNRDVVLAKRLVEAAKESGADAVKFQTWITEEVITRQSPMAEYQRQNIGADSGQFAMAKSLELSFDEFREIQEHAAKVGILFFSTPDDEKSADFLESIDVPLFKIGSPEVTNLSHLRHVAGKGRPVILSTGMSDLTEVQAAVRAMESTGNRQLALLHCLSNYPADPAECNLRAMSALADLGYPVGYSDHTLGSDVAVASVARGACILEKHLTLDRNMDGPDHLASLDPLGFTAMVRAVRLVESALGDGVKRPMPSELKVRDIVRRSIVAARELPAGAILDRKDLSIKRPGTGIPATDLDGVIGKRLRRSVAADQLLSREDLSDA